MLGKGEKERLKEVMANTEFGYEIGAHELFTLMGHANSYRSTFYRQLKNLIRKGYLEEGTTAKGGLAVSLTPKADDESNKWL